MAKIFKFGTMDCNASVLLQDLFSAGIDTGNREFTVRGNYGQEKNVAMDAMDSGEVQTDDNADSGKVQSIIDSHKA